MIKDAIVNASFLNRIITLGEGFAVHGISFMQIRGVEIRRNTYVFQGFRNEVGV